MRNASTRGTKACWVLRVDLQLLWVPHEELRVDFQSGGNSGCANGARALNDVVGVDVSQCDVLVGLHDRKNWLEFNGVSTGTNFNGLNAANFIGVGNWARVGEQLSVGHSACTNELVGAAVFNFWPPVCLNNKIRGANNFVSCSSSSIDCYFFRCGGVFCSCCVVVTTTGSDSETRSSRKSDDASCRAFHKWVLPFWSNWFTDNYHLRLGRSCL